MSISVNDFFAPISFNDTIDDDAYKQVDLLINYLESISEITYQSIYLVDYYKRAFLYVSRNPLFLCGRTPGEVLRYGYQFYFKHVPNDDLEMLLKINEAGFSFFKLIPKEDRMKYSISYDFHLRQPAGNLVLVNHKLKPLLLDEYSNPWIVLCLVSASPHSSPGNVQFRSNELQKRYDYDINKNAWEAATITKLNRREKEILMLTAQGYTIAQIASKLFISIDTIKFHRKNTFNKLGVKRISEALSTAVEQSLI